MKRSPKNMANVWCKRNPVCFHPAFNPHYSRLSIRHRASGFTLIEILIAIFVFLIGILGVLSMFPVAMNSASRTMGQVRGNILAQSALSQLTADCKVPYMQATVGTTALPPSQIPCKLSDLYGIGVDDEWNGYHVSHKSSGDLVQSRLINNTEQVAVVTKIAGEGSMSGVTLTDAPETWPVDEYSGHWLRITDGAESGNRRFIVSNTANTLTLESAFATDPVGFNYQILETRLYVCPDWNPAPTVGDELIVTRMALPVPLKGTVGSVDALVPDITASDVTWVDGQWDGYYLTMLSGTEENVSRRITATTNPSTLTLDVAFAADPSVGDEFIITRTPCGSRLSGTLTADANPGDLVDTDSTWLDDEWNDYYVRIVTSDDALNECRRISDTDDATDLLTVSPNWDAAKEPVANDTYTIIAPPRNGYIRSIVGETIHAGLDSGEDVIPLTWNTGWGYSVKASDTCPADSLASTLEVTAVDAGVADRGQVVVITGDPETNPAAGQVRIITDTNGGVSPLTVFPDWEVVPTSADDYEIRDRLGYFLVITSGRATNRTFLITGYNKNDVDGDEITCAGADFRDIGVTEARLGATSSDYKVRNATSFMIVGPDEMISSLVSHTGTGMVPTTVGPNDHGYLLNSFGIEKNAEPQTGTDFFFEAGTERETSEYSSVCIFSDAGSLSKGPVRADIVVYRNFNRAFPLPENRKPVGFLTGYIGRP